MTEVEHVIIKSVKGEDIEGYYPNVFFTTLTWVAMIFFWLKENVRELLIFITGNRPRD